MKKYYQKPQIMFEDFSVSTNIATGCTHISNADVGACVVSMKEFGGLIVNVFANQSMGCDTFSAPGIYDNLCYHVPMEGNNIFTS